MSLNSATKLRTFNASTLIEILREVSESIRDKAYFLMCTRIHPLYKLTGTLRETNDTISLGVYASLCVVCEESFCVNLGAKLIVVPKTIE